MSEGWRDAVKAAIEKELRLWEERLIVIQAALQDELTQSKKAILFPELQSRKRQVWQTYRAGITLRTQIRSQLAKVETEKLALKQAAKNHQTPCPLVSLK